MIGSFPSKNKLIIIKLYMFISVEFIYLVLISDDELGHIYTET